MPEQGPNTMPELAPPTRIIDFAGLNESMEELSEKWTPISEHTILDTEGLRRSFGYDMSEKDRQNISRFKTGSLQKVDYNGEGNA